MIYRDFNNIDIENCIGVYPVRDSTKIISRSITTLQFNSVLEVGCGTGFLSIYLKSLGFDCEGIDINERAIKRAKDNAIRNNFKINFYVSDLFQRVEKKYDLIVFNPPIANFRSHSLDSYLNIIKSLFPSKNRFILNLYYRFFKNQRIPLIKRFLQEVNNYLETNGKVVIFLSPYEFSLITNHVFKIIGGSLDMKVTLLEPK